MATPTEGEVQTILTNTMALLKKARDFGIDDADDFLTRETTLIASPIKGDFTDAVRVQASGMRADVARLLSSGRIQSLIRPILREYAAVIGVPETSDGGMLDALYRHFVTNGESVNSREFTFGSPAADVSNTGDGVINRLTTDADGFDIEAAHAEAKRAICTADKSSGRPLHQEQFTFKGANAPKDVILFAGSGLEATVNSLSAVDSQRLIQNPSFSNFSGTLAVPTDISGWTVTTDIANFQLDQTNVYRGFQGDAIPTSVRFDANDTLSQDLGALRRRFDPTVPIYGQVALNRSVFSGDGTITLTLGAVTASVALVAQVGWIILRFTIGVDNWFQNFNATNLVFSIALTGNTTGSILADDVILAPYQQFDGTWYAPVGGVTPFLADNPALAEGDEFTWTDTELGAVIQTFLFLGFGRYLPHATGATETISDPA